MSRGNKEEIFGERLFRGVSTFFAKAVFKAGPFYAPYEQTYTPTFTGFGTVTAINFTWTRVGNRLKVMGEFTAGTPTAVEARISLLGSLVSETSFITNIKICGLAAVNAVASQVLSVLIRPNVNYVVMGAFNYALANPQAALNGNVLAGVGAILTLSFEIPINGWNI